MKISANGLSLEVRVDGQAGSWVIFSNSLGTDLSMWEQQAAILCRDFRVLRYDTRGHGGSDAPPGRYQMRDLVEDVVGLMNALSIEKAHFVGLSLGGSTAMGLAITHSQRLSSVVICDARADAPPDFRAAWEDRIRTVSEHGMGALVEPTLQRWFTSTSFTDKPAVIAKVRGMIGSTGPTGFIGCARALQNLDYKTKLHAISIPTLLLFGAEDSVFPELNREMLALIPGAQMASIAAAGHLPNLEQPDAFLSALRGFLDAVEHNSPY